MSDRPTHAHDEKPTDKYARSSQAPPPGKRPAGEFVSDVEAEGVVQEASEDSFPASDPPAYAIGQDRGEEGDESKPSR
jgi:hypothetical protein